MTTDSIKDGTRTPRNQILHLQSRDAANTNHLYKSTSSLAISSGDLTFDAQGNANAIFIIQIATTLTTTSGRKVILAGGALASNIFWQVGSSATFGTTSVMKGTVIAMQSI